MNATVLREREEILQGLTIRPKKLSPKFFYDKRGSELFDRICELPEYYVTRTELTIMRRHLSEVAEQVGPRAAVIEFGAGSNMKARELLQHLEQPAAYVPVEISGEYLQEQADELASDFPNLSVRPVVADFTQPFDLPEHSVRPLRNLVFFPGSTIGNFTKPQAKSLLQVMRAEAKPGGALLIGVDLRKDVSVLEAAYNDESQVTAEFNLNMLRRINDEHEGNFELDTFRHLAVFDQAESRIEMRLISTISQTVNIADQPISFREDEFIVTEYSHKYSIADFTSMAKEAGFEPSRCWTDDDELFSMHYMTVPDTV
jgi:L-histidine N-alpha-methyltransferase